VVVAPGFIPRSLSTWPAGSVRRPRCGWRAGCWRASSRRSRHRWETTAPRLREADVIALVERSIGLFERLGGLDQRDQLLFKDIVRSNVLTASAGSLPGAPTNEELTLGAAWLEVFQQALPRSQFCAAGKLVATSLWRSCCYRWMCVACCPRGEHSSGPTRRRSGWSAGRRCSSAGCWHGRWGQTMGPSPLCWPRGSPEAPSIRWEWPRA